MSTRASAAQQGVAPSTLRGWCNRANPANDTHLSSSVAPFFETPEGLWLLHRIVVAALVVIVLMAGAGVPLVRVFLTLCGLDGRVACSDSHLHARVRALRDAVGTWGEDERTRLAGQMTPATIGVCVDETWRDGMVLVCQEPVSGFLLLEQHSERRDAVTWGQAVREGLKDLPVTLEQVTSDEAQGLLALAREQLGVPHNSDVFHGQHTLCSGIFGALRGALRGAEDAIARARHAAQKVLDARTKYLAKPRTSGRPPDWETRVGRAFEAVGEAQAVQHALSEEYAGLRVAIQDLGETINPVDLRTGTWRTPEQMRTSLVGIFEELWQRVTDVGLGERTFDAVAKAERLVTSWVGSLAWWQHQVDATLAAAGLSPEMLTVVSADRKG